MFGITGLLFGVLIGAAAPHEPAGLWASQAKLFRLVGFSAVQGNNTINGYVSNVQRRPIADLNVELLNEYGSQIRRTRTSSSGRYSFTNLLPGTYQVRVLTSGTNYIEQTQQVELVNIARRSSGGGVTYSGAEFAQLDFSLRTNETAAARAAPGTIFVQAVPADARKVYEQAVFDLDGGKRDQGMSGLQEAIKIFPTYFDALERLGTEHVTRGQHEQGFAILSRALEINATAHKCLYALGVAQYNLKQLAAASDSLRRSLTLAPDSVNAHLWLGIVLLKSKDFSGAEKHLKQAYTLSKKRVPDVHMYLAQLYSNAGRYNEAANELELFLKEAPNARDKEAIRDVIKRLRAKSSVASER